MPLIVIMCGVKGVGNITLSRILAPLVKTVALSTDKRRKELLLKPAYER